MCYPKPGPRCSVHSLKKLRNAQFRLNNADPTEIDKYDDARQKVKEAQEEYFSSPAGIKKLKDKADETGDQKYTALAKKYADKRKKQLDEYKRSIVVEPTPVVETEEAEALRKAYASFSKLSKPSEDLVSLEINAEYDYDYFGCSGNECDENYNGPCRDAEFDNLRVDPNSVNSRKTLAKIFKCQEKDVPDEAVRIGSEELNLDSTDAYDIEEETGYYGVEGASITLAHPGEVSQKLRSYYNTTFEKMWDKNKAISK